MANALAWLTGREDQTADPWPFQTAVPQPEMRAYNPMPSERVGQWLQSGFMGLGANPYNAGRMGHGVRDILQATPLGIGMSAADLVHAKNADDPMGAAAAAIGMVPGAGAAGRAVTKEAQKAGQIAGIKADPALDAFFKEVLAMQTPTAAKKSAPTADQTEQALQAIMSALDKDTAVGKNWLSTPAAAAKPTKPYLDYSRNENGTWEVFDGISGKPIQTMQNKDEAVNFIKYGKTNPTHEDIFGVNAWNSLGGGKPTVNPLSFLDYKQKPDGSWSVFHTGTGEQIHNFDTAASANAYIDAFEKGGLKPAKQIPITQTDMPPVPKFHDTFMDFPSQKPEPPSIPAKPPWLDQSAVLPEAEREAARLAGDYTTPSMRGIRVERGRDVETKYVWDAMFSTSDPKLADMYSSWISKHPGEQPAQYAYHEGATAMPLWLNTKNYHVADAQGEIWSRFNYKAIAEAKAQGKPGVVIHNVWDEPNSTQALGEPKTIYITFSEGQQTVKSKFAAMFDPKSKDISKVLAGATAGGAAYGLSPRDAQAGKAQPAQFVPQQPLSDRINEIINSLQWSDQWQGRMRLPLERKAEKYLKETIWPPLR